VQDRRVLNKIIGVRRTLGLAKRLVIFRARWLQILFKTMPARPLLTGLEIGFPKVKLGVKIAE